MTGTQTAFARAVAAEVRALMAARRVALREVASESGIGSHNYLAKRLRDEAPLTVDDVETLARYFRMRPEELVARAVANHAEDAPWAADAG